MCRICFSQKKEMDAHAALAAAQGYLQLAKTGHVVSDMTDSDIGIAYQKLHANVDFVSVHGAAIDAEEDKQTLLLENCPTFGSIWNPDVDELVKVCTTSKFGRGGETVFDTTVRKSVEYVFSPTDKVGEKLMVLAQDAAEDLFVQPAKEAFELYNQEVKTRAPGLRKEYNSGKITRESRAARDLWIEENLGPQPGLPQICIEADKLVVYKPGDHFVEHRDTVRSLGHIGTVVITLPNPGFTGGALRFPTEDCASGEANEIAVFYTDVRHCVEPVVSGTRVAVTFRVIVTNIAETKLPPSPQLYDDCDERADCESGDGIGCTLKYDPAHAGLPGMAENFIDGSSCRYPKFHESKFIELLVELLEPDHDSTSPKRAKKSKKHAAVVLGCAHMLPLAALETANDIQHLRGVDKAVADALVTLGFQVELVTVHVVTQREVYDSHDPDDVVRDVKIYSSKKLSPTCFLRAGALDALRLEHKKGSEYTGNESAPDMLTYMCVGMAVHLGKKLTN